MFIAALFTIAKTWKRSKCPLTDEWVSAGVQPRWIQGIRSGDGDGEDQETIA